MPARELRRLVRALTLAVHLLGAALCFGLLACSPLSRRWARPLRSWWLRRGIAILGVTVISRGEVSAKPALFLSNHISWLDILVLATQTDAGFVAKAEVARWPLLGWLAGVAGTEFVRRGSHADTKRVLARMVARLKAGEQLAIFPEGTSTGSLVPLRFRPRLIQAAVEAEVPVQPVALYYGARPDVAFIGDDSFLSHLWRLLLAEPVLAEVGFLPELSSVSGDCRLLADESWRAVAHALTRLELFERHSRLAAHEPDYGAVLVRVA
jgi:1-acyl-sn-glycerol-3-phosphate acyltransferase